MILPFCVFHARPQIWFQSIAVFFSFNDVRVVIRRCRRNELYSTALRESQKTHTGTTTMNLKPEPPIKVVPALNESRSSRLCPGAQ